jgi:hypothetical protein
MALKNKKKTKAKKVKKLPTKARGEKGKKDEEAGGQENWQVRSCQKAFG